LGCFGSQSFSQSFGCNGSQSLSQSLSQAIISQALAESEVKSQTVTAEAIAQVIRQRGGNGGTGGGGTGGGGTSGNCGKTTLTDTDISNIRGMMREELKRFGLTESQSVPPVPEMPKAPKKISHLDEEIQTISKGVQAKQEQYEKTLAAREKEVQATQLAIQAYLDGRDTKTTTTSTTTQVSTKPATGGR
jgi:hypothetical protein